MARILLGVSGGIAAYKALELARLATKEGHSVRVLMTPAAERFVGPASFEGIVGAPVLTDEFGRDPTRGAFPGDPVPEHDPIGHLEVVANADAYLIAPASANTIAKLAAGIADSMVTTSFLACSAPRLVAPAMNDRMYRDPATQANLATLRERGVTVIEPEEGALASRGEHGVGRLPEPRGGGGVAVEPAANLPGALDGDFSPADVLIMAAAPADFRPKRAAGEKIHREAHGKLELDLEPTEDILAALAGRRREGQTIVGFAAETSEGIDRAREKLERKGADAIVLNDVSRAEIGFESPENEVLIVERGAEHHVPLASKEQVADAILDRVEALRSAPGSVEAG